MRSCTIEPGGLMTGVALLLGVVVVVLLVFHLRLALQLRELRSRVNEAVATGVAEWKQRDLFSVQQQLAQDYRFQMETERVRFEKMVDEREKMANERASMQFAEWRQAHETSIRQDAIGRSKAVIAGKVTEHLAPYLPEFKFNPKDARFIGSPVDLLIFDGLDAGELKHVVFVEVKTGKSALTPREKQIRDAILNGRVAWHELRVGGEPVT